MISNRCIQHSPKTPNKWHDCVCTSYNLSVKAIEYHEHDPFTYADVPLPCRPSLQQSSAGPRYFYTINRSAIPRPSRRQRTRRTYPFKSPPSARARRATGKFGANPNTSILSAMPASPVWSTCLRSILSLRRPHAIPEKKSAKANADVTMPAYTEILDSSSVTPKSLIM